MEDTIRKREAIIRRIQYTREFADNTGGESRGGGDEGEMRRHFLLLPESVLTSEHPHNCLDSA